MKTIKLLKTSNIRTFRGFLNWAFVFSGCKLYLDWVLITNPTSNNPVIKFLFRWAKEVYTGTKYKDRLILSLSAGIAHLILFIWNSIAGNMLSVDNILVNLYHILVQVYIGYRCWILTNKNK